MTIRTSNYEESLIGCNLSISMEFIRLFSFANKGTAPRDALRRGLKKDKLYCLSLQAAPRDESWEKFIFHGAAFFGVNLWPITIARRVTFRKKLPSMHNQHHRNRIFTRRAASSGATFAEFCSAFGGALAL